MKASESARREVYARIRWTCRSQNGNLNRVMSTTIEALYDDGKLILQQPLPLPAKTRVLVTVETDRERGAWLRVSEEGLLRAWDNSDDDVFNELLTK
ncbi:MAG: hypothetical protein DME33_04105 [Verrucomicrobia bacterium]|nr:MAG: hypothetical protein DME33_04105 [Verrucomicrobiota bacterium]